MRQSCKYGLFLVIALLIHAFTIESVENSSKVFCPTDCWQKTYSYHKDSSRNIPEQMFHLYVKQACEIGHADAVHIPGDKTLLLPVFYLREHPNPTTFLHTRLFHLPHYFYDPITHYIYALRKIVI